MIKDINYHYKGETNSQCTYVTVQPESMEYLIYRATILLAMYSELTSQSGGEFVIKEKDGKKYGKRSRGGSYIANNRISLLGGLIHNYYKKEPHFRNDISEGQIPYITNVINECCAELNEPEIRFKNNLFY
jgi:hypothetical protein